jgi:hypothetical protein
MVSFFMSSLDIVFFFVVVLLMLSPDIVSFFMSSIAKAAGASPRLTESAAAEMAKTMRVRIVMGHPSGSWFAATDAAFLLDASAERLLRKTSENFRPFSFRFDTISPAKDVLVPAEPAAVRCNKVRLLADATFELSD